MSMRPPEILRLRLRCDAAAPRLARRAVERLEEIRAIREDALLLTSELASNAVARSGFDPGEEIELRAELLPDGVRILVRGEGRSRRRPILRALDPDRPGRLGLGVVQTVSRQWGSERDDGMCVWAEIAF